MSINLHKYRSNFDLLSQSLDLDRLCGCQLESFADAVEFVEPDEKEELLGLLYLESLVQGFVYSYDLINFWKYLKVIGDRSINMCYHGGEVQFRLMLLIPEYKPTFDLLKLHDVVHRKGLMYLPLWRDQYAAIFGKSAIERLMMNLSHDADLERLIEEFSCLKAPIRTTFGLED
ncbi:MAG TPA: hypothetical protein VNJ08_08835 [Bacteriovoracaceae bacterium]|nr:hypothetical protein [Bacteriovoracaceae bacterium]